MHIYYPWKLNEGGRETEPPLCWDVLPSDQSKITYDRNTRNSIKAEAFAHVISAGRCHLSKPESGWGAYVSPGKREDDKAPSDILPYLNILNWEKQNLCNFCALHGKWLETSSYQNSAGYVSVNWLIDSLFNVITIFNVITMWSLFNVSQ